MEAAQRHARAKSPELDNEFSDDEGDNAEPDAMLLPAEPNFPVNLQDDKLVL